MNIVVLVKSALDEGELRADSEGHPILVGAATKTSNFDMNGVEEAVKAKESNGGTVTVLSLGGQDAKKAIKEAMAMGGTKGTHIVTGPEDAPDSLATAFCLASVIKRIPELDVIFCSEGSSDTYQGQVGAMVAEFLGVPFLAYAKNIRLQAGKVTCEQNFDGRVVVSEARLPAVVSVVSEANVPRYPTLLQVMVAGRKPIEDIAFGSLQVPEYPRTGTKILGIYAQPSDRKKTMLEGSPTEASRKLVDALRSEGLI
jgi:electron transfer flavoprotein beta subunit